MQPNDVLIDRFKILRHLASGGMAEVYFASDLKYDRTVVVKVLKKSLTHSQVLHKRFDREVQNSKLLRHPNIVTVVGGGDINGELFMVMELMDGGSLFDLIRRVGKFPWPLACEIMLAVLNGLAFSHEKMIIHRDMKPDNLLLSKTGEVKITDFGISKALEATVMTQEGELLGTPAYMAPEQVAGGEITSKTDLFAAGVIFYELLTGKNPFLGNGINETISRVISMNPPPPNEVDKTIPEALGVAVMRLMEKDVNNRFETAGEAIERIEYLLQKNGLQIGKDDLRITIEDPERGKMEVGRKMATRQFSRLAIAAQETGLRNVREAYDFASSILDTFELDPSNPTSQNYFRELLKQWGAALPRRVSREILRMEEEFKGSGLEASSLLALATDHEQSGNYLEAIYFFGVLRQNDPGNEEYAERVAQNIQSLRSFLSYRLLGDADSQKTVSTTEDRLSDSSSTFVEVPQRKSSSQKIQSPSKLHLQRQTPQRPSSSPSIRSSRPSMERPGAQPSSQPTRPMGMGPMGPRGGSAFGSGPTPSRQFSVAPAQSRQVPPPPGGQKNAGGRGIMYALVSTLVLLETVYIGASLIMEASPAHVVLQRIETGDAEAGTPDDFPDKYAPDEEKIKFYKKYIDSFTNPRTKTALTELLPLLQAQEDWAGYNKYKAILDAHFPDE